MMWRLARPFLPALLAVLAVSVAVYGLLLRALRGRGRQICLGSRSQPFLGAGFFLFTILLLGLLGKRFIGQDKAEGQSALLLAESSPWWRRAVDPPMDRATFVAPGNGFVGEGGSRSGPGGARFECSARVPGIILQQISFLV